MGGEEFMSGEHFSDDLGGRFCGVRFKSQNESSKKIKKKVRKSNRGKKVSYTFFQAIYPSLLRIAGGEAYRVTSKELIFAGTNFCGFCGFGLKLQTYKFLQNVSNAKYIGRIIHRMALIFFQVRNPQN